MTAASKAKTATKKTDGEIQIARVDSKTLTLRILGLSPILHNSLSAKTRQQLLMPPVKKNAAAKAQSLKHDPYAEYQSAPYINSDPDADTYIEIMASAFKGAMKSAALDLPGTTKSQIGRLTWVNGERISIYGVPEMHMSIVRSADINRTPDVRTRCIMREWAAEISMTYVSPALNEVSVINLLASAGLMSGVGDFRPGKGAGSYGQFELVNADDARWQHVVDNGGRDIQVHAMANPTCYDDEARELLSWFDVESNRRGFEVVGAAK